MVTMMLRIMVRAPLLIVGSLTMAILTSPRLALLMAFIIPVVLVPILVFGRKVRKFSRQSQDRVADFSAVANETIEAGMIAASRARTSGFSTSSGKSGILLISV